MSLKLLILCAMKYEVCTWSSNLIIGIVPPGLLKFYFLARVVKWSLGTNKHILVIVFWNISNRKLFPSLELILKMIDDAILIMMCNLCFWIIICLVMARFIHFGITTYLILKSNSKSVRNIYFL